MQAALAMQEEGRFDDDGSNPPFWSYARDWWIWDKCPYVKESLRNGRRLTRGYVGMCRTEMLKYIDPAFHDRPLKEITSGEIDEWKYALHERHGLSKKSANNYLTILRTMFDYWWRHGVIETNPCVKVKPMAAASRRRGILTVGEVRTLFSRPGLWRNPVAELANLTAAITGMRMGEIQALRHRDVRLDGLLVVEHSWSEEYGLKETKTYRSREIPIPATFARRLYAQNGHDDEFVFSIGDPHKPLRRSCILDNLRSALERMGVPKAVQDSRGICFHSWRHYLNTRLRESGLPDAITQQITGHSTMEMTEHYSHITGHDLDKVLEVTGEIL